MPVEVSQSWAGPYHRMPLELPKDRAAMIAKAIEADDGACSTGAMMADPAPVAAKPSLLDELAEAARSEWLATGAVVRWDRIALSVARRLLEREPSEGAIEAFAVEWERKGSTVPECLKAYNRSQLAELEGKA